MRKNYNFIIILVIFYIALYLNNDIQAAGVEDCASMKSIDLDASRILDVRIGRPYDFPRQIINAGNLFGNEATIAKNINILTTTSQISELKVETKSSDRYSMLDIDASITLEMESGSVEAGMKLLKESKANTNVERLMIYFQRYTFTEQFREDILAEIPINDFVLGPKSTATHVITSITYGARALIFLEFEESDAQKRSDLAIKLKLKMEEIDLGVGLKLKDDEKDYFKSVKVTTEFQGAPQESVVGSIDEAFEALRLFYKRLAQDGEKGRAMIIKLDPLCRYRGDGPSLFLKQLNNKLIDDALDIYNDLDALIVRSNGLITEAVRLGLRRMSDLLGDFKKHISVFRANMQRSLAEILPSVKSGRLAESQLNNLIADANGSPFNIDIATWFLNAKEAEMKYYDDFYFDLIREIPNVSSKIPRASSDISNDVFGGKGLLNPSIDTFAIFFFVAREDSTNDIVNSMKRYNANPLSKVRVNVSDLVSTPWYDMDFNLAHLRKSKEMLHQYLRRSVAGASLGFPCFLNQASNNIDKPICDPKRQGFYFVDYLSHEQQLNSRGIYLKRSGIAMFRPKEKTQLITADAEYCSSPDDPRNVFNGKCIWGPRQVPEGKRCNEHIDCTTNFCANPLEVNNTAAGLGKNSNLFITRTCMKPNVCPQEVICNSECVISKKNYYDYRLNMYRYALQQKLNSINNNKGADLLDHLLKLEISINNLFGAVFYYFDDRYKCNTGAVIMDEYKANTHFGNIGSSAVLTGSIGEIGKVEGTLLKAYINAVRSEATSDIKSILADVDTAFKNMNTSYNLRLPVPESLCRCVDIDSCASRPNACPKNTFCYDKVGKPNTTAGYECMPLPGFEPVYHANGRILQGGEDGNACIAAPCTGIDEFCVDLPPPAANDASGRECRARTTCPAGMRAVAVPSDEETDRTCEDCPEGTFQPSFNFVGTSCMKHNVTSCSNGGKLNVPPSKVSDGVCLYCKKGETMSSSNDDANCGGITGSLCYCKGIPTVAGKLEVLATCDQGCCQFLTEQTCPPTAGNSTRCTCSWVADSTSSYTGRCLQTGRVPSDNTCYQPPLTAGVSVGIAVWTILFAMVAWLVVATMCKP